MSTTKRTGPVVRPSTASTSSPAERVNHLSATAADPTMTTTPTPTTTTSATPRTSPFLPTPLERLAMGIFPALLAFGSLYAALSPTTRAMTYDAVSQSYLQPSPDDAATAVGSYFARKSNVVNVYFVKRGWGWTTLGLLAFVASRRRQSGTGTVGVSVRWAALTAWWIVVVQWCWGAPLIDRGFRWTGGRCTRAISDEEDGAAGGVGAVLTAAACRAAGGQWRGGHDISGHVFLLTLGSAMLMHEVLWPLARGAGWAREERCVVMADGAVKGAGVEARTGTRAGVMEVGYGGRFALGVLGLNLWMLLMTAIYFHTWFEKLTGLVMAYIGIYAVYYVPRFVPALRMVVGLPGI